MIRPIVKRDILRNFRLRFITNDTDFRFIIFIILANEKIFEIKNSKYFDSL